LPAAGWQLPYWRGLLVRESGLRSSFKEGVVSYLYLSSFSPDFHAIEEAFAKKIKGILWKAEARSREALIETIG
jgi:hypothetical protein